MQIKHFIGIDIIEISRIEKAISEYGERFLGRIFTDAERELCHGNAASLAARFAAKEAVVKALPSHEGIGWKDIEVLSENSGRPYVKLYGKAREQADSLKLTGFDISLSHCREYAVAFVIGESNNPFDRSQSK